jgi:hypothetical protein
MVKKLSNDIIDMKRNAGKGNQGQRPYKPFFKRNPPFKSIKRDFSQWVHAMNLMANWFLDEVSLTEQPSSSVMNVADQEEIDPPEGTTMLIWDPGLIMPSDDLF